MSKQPKGLAAVLRHIISPEPDPTLLLTPQQKVESEIVSYLDFLQLLQI